MVAQPAPKSWLNTAAREGAANPVDKIAVAKASARKVGAISGRDLKFPSSAGEPGPLGIHPAALPPGGPRYDRRETL
jgi:hypothetical protein